ncbi:MAG: phage holin family protein [Chitinophagaceae bacterium]
MQMNDLKEKTADLADHVEDLADTFYRLTVVNITQKSSNIASGIIVAITIGILSFFVLMFLGIALAWWLGDVLENRTAGFLLGAGIFLVVVVIIALLRKQIISPIRNLIIRKLYD